jgi:hypothetical protein
VRLNKKYSMKLFFFADIGCQWADVIKFRWCNDFR